LKKISTEFLENLPEGLPDRMVVRQGGADTLPNGQGTPLNEALNKVVSQYYADEKETPQFCYITHQRYDGLISSRQFYNHMAATESPLSPVYNPAINEQAISSLIKPKALKRRAYIEGYIERPKNPIWPALLVSSSGIGNIISLIVALRELAADTAQPFANFGFTQLAFLALFVVFISSLTVMILQKRKQTKDSLAALDNKLTEDDIDQFEDFLDGFSHDDFRIPDCLSAGRQPVFICSLQYYNARQRCILRRYLSTLGEGHKQCWCIFAEDTHADSAFFLEQAEDRASAFFTMKNLSLSDKRALLPALQKRCPNPPSYTKDDLKHHGVDFIFRPLLRRSMQAVNREYIKTKLDDFHEKYCNSHIGIDLRVAVRLIAALSYHFNIDFFQDSHTWEIPFKDAAATDLQALDNALAKEINLDNAVLRRLVPVIRDTFRDDLDDVAVAFPLEDLSHQHLQWCLVKAIKMAYSVKPDRYPLALEIADTLRAEIQKANASATHAAILQDPNWLSLLMQAVRLFYDSECLWILPTLLHHMLSLFEQAPAEFGALYSSDVILKAARANLLLNINAAAAYDDDDELDLIADHYQIVRRAVQEKFPNTNLTAGPSYPEALQLLRFSDADRLAYYHALTMLGETAVLDYYSYLFDLYCTAAKYIEGYHDNFLFRSFYTDRLYDKYLRNKNILNPTPGDYFRLILEQLSDVLRRTLGNQNELSGVVSELNVLTSLLNKTDPSQLANAIFPRLIRYDTLGTVTLSFFASLIVRMNMELNKQNDDEKKNENDSADKQTDLSFLQEVYLNLGNYLIGLVFLSCHELESPSFYNTDYAWWIRLLTAYDEPHEAVFGYLAFCNIYVGPKASKQHVADYLANHKQAYHEKLETLFTGAKMDKLEYVIHFIDASDSSIINEAEATKLFTSLRKVVQENNTSPKAPVLNEWLTLLIEHCSSEAFADDTPENNLNKAITAEFSDNTLCLLYQQYMLYCEDTYLEVFPLVASRILNSKLASNLSLALRYVFGSSRSDTPAYAQTIIQIYIKIKDRLTNHLKKQNPRELELILLFFDYLELNRSQFDWFNDKEVSELKNKAIVYNGHLLCIENKDFLNQRSWTQYGIVQCLRHLMTIHKLTLARRPEDYPETDEEKQLDYIVEHFESLKPVISVDKRSCFNRAYIDMLDAFIKNKRDLQTVLQPRPCLQKFVEDTKNVIQVLALIDKTHRDELVKMVEEYNTAIENTLP